jgi:hypothetical protein
VKLSYRLIVRKSIHEISKPAWNTLTGQTPFAGWKWQEFCERVQKDDQPFYLIVQKNDAFVAAAICWLYKKPSIPDFPHFVENLLSPIFHRRPLLICGIPVAETYGLVLPDDPDVSRDALQLIREGIQSLSSENKALFSIFGFLPAWLAIEKKWPIDYHLVQLFPGTKIDFADIPDYETYLQQRTKKHRKNIRRNTRAAKENGAVVIRQSNVDPNKAYELAANVTARHNFPLQEEMRRVFKYVDMVDSCWLTIEINGRMVGFDLLLGDKGHWMVKTTGNDYSSDHVYFLLSDEDIRFAIDVGASVLSAGTHLYQVKYRLGYEQRNDGYVRYSSTSRLGNLLGRLIDFRTKPAISSS